MARTVASRKRLRSKSRKRKTNKRFRTTFKKPVVKLSQHISPRTGLGNYQWVTMNYVFRGTINPPLAGGTAVEQFRVNSIFDPYLTGIGGQPMGHDQFEPLFESYLVTGCRYRVCYQNVGNNGYCVGVYVSDQSTFTAETEAIIEQGSVDWELLGTVTGSHSVEEFNGYIDIPKLQGRQWQNYLDDERGGANFGSNPQDPVYLTCFSSDSSSGDPGEVRVWVELQFKVLLRGNKYTPRS